MYTDGPKVDEIGAFGLHCKKKLANFSLGRGQIGYKILGFE